MHPHNNKHLTITCSLGTFLEWLDTAFYAYMANKLAALFFPELDHRDALLATLCVFAAGFLMRPVGAIIFGYIGDKLGRRTALSKSLLLMGIASLGIAITPTYASIGIYAPIILLSFRLLQGLCIGGEHNGAAIFLMEHTKKYYPTLAGSWIVSAATLGILAGSLIASIVTATYMPEWAWRIPFIAGGLSILLGIHLRTYNESPEFIALKNNHYAKLTTPIIEIFKNYKFAFSQAFLLAAFLGTDIYICNLYYVTYANNFTHFSASTITLLSTIGALGTALLLPLMAIMADYIGNRSILCIGLLGTAITTPMIFLLTLTNDISLAILAQIIYAIFNATISGTILKFIFDLFPTEIRYTACSLAWSLGIASFVGTAPVIAGYITQDYDFLNAASLYVTFIALVCLIYVFGETKTHRTQCTAT